MSDLLVLHDDNGVFLDHSKEAKDYLRDSFTINYTQAEDFIYIGLYKPFNNFYVELEVVDSGNLSFEINNNVIAVDDDTKSFSRSGFISFNKPNEWAVETINGSQAYWVKVSSSISIAPEFKGINIVFSDDQDLKQEVRNIDNLKAKNDKSFIAYHLAARNEMIQTLRNGGFSKKADNLVKNITKWDLLEFGEIRQASKYLTLAKIFFDISENNEDKFYEKYRDYEGSYGSAFKLYYMKIDQNDDGKYDQDKDLVLNNCEITLV